MSDPITVYDVETGEKLILAAPRWVAEMVEKGVYSYAPPTPKSERKAEVPDIVEPTRESHEQIEGIETMSMDEMLAIAKERKMRGLHFYKDPEKLREKLMED